MLSKCKQFFFVTINSEFSCFPLSYFGQVSKNIIKISFNVKHGGLVVEIVFLVYK